MKSWGFSRMRKQWIPGHFSLRPRGLGMRLADHAHRCTQMHADARRRTQTNADEYKANCVWCVGGRNLKTRPDIRCLFKDFRDVLYLREEKSIGVYHEVFSQQNKTAKTWAEGSCLVHLEPFLQNST